MLIASSSTGRASARMFDLSKSKLTPRRTILRLAGGAGGGGGGGGGAAATFRGGRLRGGTPVDADTGRYVTHVTDAARPLVPTVPARPAADRDRLGDRQADAAAGRKTPRRIGDRGRGGQTRDAADLKGSVESHRPELELGARAETRGKGRRGFVESDTVTAIGNDQALPLHHQPEEIVEHVPAVRGGNEAGGRESIEGVLRQYRTNLQTRDRVSLVRLFLSGNTGCGKHTCEDADPKP
jgi:hypothetical protein